ncbi:hypothetical protein GCM10010293_02880 [Streptomyces griseoflavus]|nr:hypothetical protein GCM10010293_02880 [Streptomyces griseoflavus]
MRAGGALRNPALTGCRRAHPCRPAARLPAEDGKPGTARDGDSGAAGIHPPPGAWNRTAAPGRVPGQGVDGVGRNFRQSGCNRIKIVPRPVHMSAPTAILAAERTMGEVK